MPTPVRVKVTNSWLKLKEKLERTPKMMANLPKMKIAELPKITSEPAQATLPDEFSYIVEDDEDGPEIEGDVYEEGLFASYIKPGLDVVIYSDNQEDRPWVGRVHEILENNRFLVHWFKRHGKSSKFHAQMDGSDPYVTELEFSNVMMWNISAQKMDTSFYVTPYRLAQILNEYQKYDAIFSK